MTRAFNNEKLLVKLQLLIVEIYIVENDVLCKSCACCTQQSEIYGNKASMLTWNLCRDDDFGKSRSTNNVSKILLTVIDLFAFLPGFVFCSLIHIKLVKMSFHIHILYFIYACENMVVVLFMKISFFWFIFQQ